MSAYWQFGGVVVVAVGVVHWTNQNESIWRKLMIIGIVILVVGRAMFLSSLMGPSADAEDKKAARNEAIAAFKQKRFIPPSLLNPTKENEEDDFKDME
jgi:hypothetical protein